MESDDAFQSGDQPEPTRKKHLPKKPRLSLPSVNTARGISSEPKRKKSLDKIDAERNRASGGKQRGPKKPRLNLSDKLHQVTTELAEREKQHTLLLFEYTAREEAYKSEISACKSDKLHPVTTELAELEKQHALLIAEYKAREETYKSEIRACSGISNVVPLTMLIHVVIDLTPRGSYRVFCETKVRTVLDDIRVRHNFSDMCADMFHETRILLPEDMLCSQLKNILLLDSNGNVTIFFSMGADFVML